MPIVFPGRVEARWRVPSGGVSLNVTHVTGPHVVTIPAGDYYLTAAGGVDSILDELEDRLNADAGPANWTVTMDASTGLVTIHCTGDTFLIEWTNTDLRDALGYSTDSPSNDDPFTGTAQAKGLWLPDSPMNCDDHPSMAPEETDLRTSESPTGYTLGLCGNQRYVHPNVRYQRVPVDRIREASATYDNASLEVFFRDTQSGQGGSPFFQPASPVQVYWNNAGTSTLLGADANSGAGVAGWYITGISRFGELARMSQAGFAGQFDVRFPRLVSDG